MNPVTPFERTCQVAANIRDSQVAPNIRVVQVQDEADEFNG